MTRWLPITAVSRQSVRMSNRAGVVAVGVAAGVIITMSPDGAVPFVALGAAIMAGVLRPGEPMVAAALVLAPTFVVALMRTLVDSDRDVGALFLALVSALFVTAIVTHLSAGVVLRRRA